MQKAIFLFLLLFHPLFSIDLDIPVSYQGRYHPANAYAHLWFDGFAKQADHLNYLWKRHFLGNKTWDDAPFFHVGKKKWSYNQLNLALSENPLDFLKPILIFDSIKKHRGQNKIELFPGLWTAFQGDDLILLKVPETYPWNLLKPKTVIAEKVKSRKQKLAKTIRTSSDDAKKLLEQMHHYLEETFKVLPGLKGEWFFLKELKNQDKNFTLYSDSLFEKVRSTYLLLERAYQHGHETSDLDRQFSDLLREGYQKVAGQKIQQAHAKTLSYPTFVKLKAESFLFRFPFIELAIFFYLFACIFCIYRPKWGLILMGSALLIQTALLLLRTFIMGRPPVSNMYETMLYVPWIIALSGFCLHFVLPNRSILIGANAGALAILGLVLFGPLNDRLENVPAVLDSQYWLIIHVLMVVGSYGFFIFSGILSHFYFFSSTPTQLSKGILQTMYIGTGLLITGTILGGIWAAQSWGRFWDWDPKESWAFVSCCTYLVIVHLYRFNQISFRGLAIGSIIGLQVITFTWYGVNYILGTGLHSYGFGSGGTSCYYAFIALELGFIGFISRKFAF